MLHAGNRGRFRLHDPGGAWPVFPRLHKKPVLRLHRPAAGADELIVGSGSSVTSIGTDDYTGTDRAYVITKDLYSDKFYTNILAVNGITFAPTTVTVNGTQYTLLAKQ